MNGKYHNDLDIEKESNSSQGLQISDHLLIEDSEISKQKEIARSMLS